MAGIQIDGVNNKIDFDDDADTSISSSTDDTLVVEVGGNTLATVTATGVTINDGTTITTADTSTTLTLKSTDASASAAPRMVFERDSASPADSDQLGLTMYFADNDAGESTNFFEIKALAVDVSDGTEDGQLRFSGMKGGSSVEYMRFDPGSAGIVINDGAADIDFRVEGDANTKILMADAGDNGVYFGNSGNTTPAQSSTATHTFISAIGRMQISASSHAAITTNRVNSEGTTVEFRQAGGVRGSISVGGASTAFNTSSDYRLKENVDYTWDGTTILKQLKPAKFNWKVDPDNTIHGFLAHEAQAVVPDSVIGEKDAVDDNGDVAPQQIDQSKLVPILVKTVQELEARIATLEGN